MKGFVANIEETAKQNTNFRHVLYTSRYSQLVVMNILSGQEIGNEIHGVDQFIRVEKGSAKAVLNNGENEYQLSDGFAIVIPAGTWHNIINTGTEPLKLYTIYSPPEHADAILEPTKEDAKEEQFNGITSE